jgi:hypothetical protein
VGPRGADRRQPRGRARPGFVATRSLETKIEAVHRSLKGAGLPHAFGGAIALGYYAEPRKTKDIDVNVFVPVERWPQVREALAPLGVDTEVEESGLKTDGQVKLAWEENPLHLFFSQDALHVETERKTRSVSFAETTIPLLAPEHLVIRKALLDRPKDRRDIESILARTPVDRTEVDRWVRRPLP